MAKKNPALAAPGGKAPPLPEEKKEGMPEMKQKNKAKASAALPDDVLLKGCEFIKSKTWREFNNKGIKTFGDLLRLILEKGDVKEVFKALDIPPHGHAVSSVRDRLDLFRKYGSELSKISPDEAKVIFGRLKESARRAKQKAGNKETTQRQAQPKAAPKDPAVSRALQPAASQAVIVGDELMASLEYAALQGQLAALLMPVVGVISSEPLANLESVVEKMENNLALMKGRGSVNSTFLEIARLVVDLRQLVKK